MVPSPRADNVWSYCTVLGPIVAMALNVLVQIILMRLRGGMQFLRAVIESFIFGLGGLLLMETFLLCSKVNTGENIPTVLLVNIPTYIALSYCSFNFANLGQSSIRIRIYSEIAATPNGIQIEQIAKEYNEQSLIQMRLLRLTESGDLVLKNGFYQIGRQRFIQISNFIFMLKKFILGKVSEFE